MQIAEWINYQVELKDLEKYPETLEEKDFETKVRFISHFEKWVRKWREEGVLDSFHLKHHRHLLRVRIRLLPRGDKREVLATELQRNLAELGDKQILERSHEIPKEEEDFSWTDDVIWRILEHNTEILFVLVGSFGKDYRRNLKEKYWTGKFDMIHLLLNQLGMAEPDNLQELFNVLSRFYGIRFEFKPTPTGGIES